MRFDPDKEAGALTPESLRPKFYAFIREGRKFRIASKTIRISIICVALLIFGFQIYSAFKPSFRRSADVIFTPPQLRAEIVSSYIPQVMNDTRAEEFEKQRFREMTSKGRRLAPVIEKIKPIALGRLSGIPGGSEVMAELKSGGANGMVKVELLENLSAQGDVVLPKATILLGQGSSSEERLYITFRKAILPDKTVSKINALAYDEKDRILGLKGKKVSDYAFRLATSAGLIFLGGMADGMRDDSSQNPFAARRPTMRDSALNGVSTATSDMSHEVIQGMKNQQERVEVAHSTHLLIIFGDTNDKDQ